MPSSDEHSHSSNDPTVSGSEQALQPQFTRSVVERLVDMLLQSLIARGVLLAVLNLIVFLQTRNFEFVDWDDLGQVMSRVGQFDGLTVESVSWAFSNHVGGWMTPLSWTSLLIDRHLWGMNPEGYHLTNMFLHMLTTWSLCAALTRLTKSPSCSFLVACLFAVHPLHVEPVAWVTGRWELIAGLFWACGLLAWSYFVYSRSKWAYLAVMVSYIAAVLGKPMALTFPFVLLLLDFWPLHRLNFGSSSESRATLCGRDRTSVSAIPSLVAEKLPLFAMMSILTVMSIQVKKGATNLAYTEQFSIIGRVGNALQTYVFYTWQTLWPHNLACFYPHPSSIGQLSMSSVGVAGLILAAITMGVLLSVKSPRRWGFLLFGWLYYLGTFVPAIGIVQVELYSTADRYTYLPLTGLLIILVWGLTECCKQLRVAANTRYVGVMLVLALLVNVSYRQCETWKNSDTLWTHAAVVRNSNYRAHSVLAYLAMGRGNLAKAETHATECVRICPQYVHGPIQLGLIRLNQRRSAEAVELFRLALQRAPDLLKPRIALGRALRESGQVSASIEELEKVLAMAPSNELAIRELSLSRAASEQILRSAESEEEAIRPKVSNWTGGRTRMDKMASRDNFVVPLMRLGRTVLAK